MSEESRRMAKGYADSLSTAIEAYDIINELLEEKILVASGTVIRYDKSFSNGLLEELAKTLEVDEIYSYNPQGEILYSNNGEYIGWKAYEGHPVYNFMTSKSISLVEDIRQDTESGIYYKYGYFKASDGRFVQIGVLAEKIHAFLKNFEMEYLLNEMLDDSYIAQVGFIDNELNIIAKSDDQIMGTEILNSAARAAIIEDREYFTLETYNGMRRYEILIPIYINNTKIGTLAIIKAVSDTEGIIRKVSLISILTLLLIFILLTITMFSIYKKNKKLMYLAYYDSLTKLPNKEYLHELLRDEISNNKERNKGVLLVNCSNFKIINLTFGYQYGDKIIVEIANKLDALIVEKSYLFRLSDDRFIIYVRDYNNQNELFELCSKICEVFESPFQASDVNKYIGVKIGVVEIDSKHNDVDKLLKYATIAANNVEENALKNYCFFDEIMERRLLREKAVENELRKAIDDNDDKKIYLEYQPQVDLKTNKIIGFEALARMHSEELGVVTPIEFIDIAEKRQLIVSLGQWIIKTACGFIKTIENQGYNGIKMAVNISAIQFLQNDFFPSTMNTINEIGINPSNLELELTESVFTDNYEVINEKLERFKRQGIKIALDDFGTGYSSLARIRELHIDSIKIDKFFIHKLLDKNHGEVITGDIISLAHRLGLTVVAEGVEVEEQKEYLMQNDCDIMQGYLFSKPVSKENIINLLKDNN